MLSKALQKKIRSLEYKKFRQEYGLFIAEGNKLTSDLLKVLRCRVLVATDDWLAQNKNIPASEIISTDKETLTKTSLLKCPQEVLGLFEIPQTEVHPDDLKGKLSLVLDNIQDPGNLGTILRIADWFGIEYVICSRNTADAFNPKTVQATMGAIGRVKIFYTDLDDFIPNTGLPVYGTFLEGEIIYNCDLPQEALIVMGNEGNGISDETSKLITKKIFIPDFPLGMTKSESLNVSTATAIVCSEFRRRAYQIR